MVGSQTAHNFMGWGNGRLDQGAHTAKGGPLIPPNQHLEVTLQKQAASTIVTYQVRADDPDYDAYQVFLEQGLGLAFNYGGLDPFLIGLLGTAFGVISPGDFPSKLTQLRNLAKSDPKGFDEAVRTLYHE